MNGLVGASLGPVPTGSPLNPAVFDIALERVRRKDV